jgi:proteasome beta subunit
MEGYGPQFTQLPQMPQISEPNQAPNGGAWMPGATTIGVVCSDGVILASEKRVTYGNFIMSKGGKKVFKVTDRIGVACAGLVGDMQILAREVEAQANLFSMDVGRPITVKAAAKLMANILFNRRYAPLITQNYCWAA